MNLVVFCKQMWYHSQKATLIKLGTDFILAITNILKLGRVGSTEIIISESFWPVEWFDPFWKFA